MEGNVFSAPIAPHGGVSVVNRTLGKPIDEVFDNKIMEVDKQLSPSLYEGRFGKPYAVDALGLGKAYMKYSPGAMENARAVDGTTQTISATLTPVSAKPGSTIQGLVINANLTDANQMHVSATQLDAGLLLVSSKQGDAGLFRVSAIGGTAGDRTLVDGTTQTISATLTPISTAPAETVAGLVTNTFQDDADEFHASAFSLDAGTFHVSAIGNFLSANQQISAVLLGGTAFIGDVSGLSPDAGLFRISAILAAGVSSVGAASFGVSAAQTDAGVLHVSGFTATATNFPVSAVQSDAGLQHTSGYSGDANQLHTSSVQSDAGLQHVSASVFPDTTGGLTIFSGFNVSTSQNIKAGAGAVYGWYAWNMGVNPAYINLYNTSGATNVGVDAIQVQIALAASAAANVFTPIGLKGFTAGISVAAVSGAVSTSNSSPAASAVGINLFYK